MAKKPTIKSEKKKAWDVFSKYIRARDGIRTTGDPNMCICITCPKRDESKNMQAGHFVDGRSRYVLFEERAVHAQCVGCNMFKSGNKDAYWPVMLNRYGKDVCEELVNLKHKTGTWTVPDLQEKKEEYQNKLKELLKEHRESHGLAQPAKVSV